MDCSPQGSSVHEISQTRILERVAIIFPEDLPSPGIKPRSPELQADSLPLSYFGSLIKKIVDKINKFMCIYGRKYYRTLGRKNVVCDGISKSHSVLKLELQIQKNMWCIIPFT